MRIWLAMIGLLALALAAPLRADPNPPGIAAAHPLAAEAGMSVLRQGGSAVDAAIAVQAVLTLVEPQSSGIGGGAFMLFRDAASGRIEAWDGRETAPAAATGSLFLDDDGKPLGFFEAVVGGRAVGVPGVLRMLADAHAAHGRLPWAELFTSAIHLAETGFRVSQRLHFLLERDRHLASQPAAAAYFYDADGAAWPVGHRLRNPALAATLRQIAADGADALHSGPLAEAIVAAVRTHSSPGLLTLEDLAGYRAKLRQPVCIDYRQWSVCGMPPPTSGGVTVGQILGLLRGFDPADLAPGTTKGVHLVSEAARLAYADRGAWLADSDFVAVPVEGLLDDAYLARRAAAIDPDRAMGVAEAGDPLRHGAIPPTGRDLNQPSTTHFSIVDAAGNVVSMTASVENAFGSRLLVGGFLLNNQLTDFSFEPTEADGTAVANRVEAGKRPRSSMSPTIVLNRDGSFRLAIGSPGGSRIIGYVAKTLVAVLDDGLPVQEAVGLPHHVNRNGPLELEDGSPLTALAPALRKLGHEVRTTTLNSGLHGIEFVDGQWRGGADPRREGVVLFATD
ncbi:MAG: gamma-glutamyltransferase [Pseudomonadota bacterium]|nr:gamma-glutamyltransferase [Pseudomonadota bacterium]